MRRFELLDFILGGYATAWEVADGFQISIYCARVRLKRAVDYGWLQRKKEMINGQMVYAYFLTQKAWDFYDKYGSFLDGNPFYGHGPSRKPPVIVNLVSSP